MPVTIEPSAPRPDLAEQALSGSFQSDLDVSTSFFERFDDAIPQLDSVKPLIACYRVDADLDMDVTGVIAEPGKCAIEIEESGLANGCLQLDPADRINGPAV
jgi:hypothetical protein